MYAVRVDIVRSVDDHQPGWVECALTDARGQRWCFREKVPVVSTQHLSAESPYPQPGVIACLILDRQRLDGHSVVTIDTSRPWSVTATTGETQFVVRSEQVIEIAAAGQGGTHTDTL